MPGSMKSTETEVIGKGKLVALEGDTDIISTQLRLLPPSQKILILPSILEDLPKLQENETFNARTFVKQVHEVFTKRTQHAQSFLGSSTDIHPRLVFTHGGCLDARSTCITRIAESSTDGKIDEAEALFNEIVKDGVAGLTRCEAKQERPKTEVQDKLEDDNLEELHHTPEDASTTAMRAAESLDREAASLTTDTPVDDTEDTLCGDTPSVDERGLKAFHYQEGESEDEENVSSETPLMNMTESFEESKINSRRKSKIPVREFIFTTPGGDEIKRTMVVLPQSSSLWDRRNNSGSKIPHLAPFSSASYSSVPTSCERSGSLIDEDFDIQSPGTDTFPSTPVVVYGEACLVDMQSNESDSPPLRKVKSVDRVFPGLLTASRSVSSPKSLRQTASFCHPQPRPMTSDIVSATMSEYFQAVPRTTFVKASETTIRRTPTGSDCTGSSTSSLKAPSLKTLVVDRDASVDVVPEANAENNLVIFEPVLPVVEDLIINFTPMGSNEIFDLVLASCTNGSYPASPKTDAQNNSEAADDHVAAENDCAKRHTYDPYAHYNDAKTQWPLRNDTRHQKATHQELSTPCRTPGFSERVINISPLDSISPVTLQNSLRQRLSVVFPTSDGYSQHLFPVTAEMERLWKPVFKTDESGSIDESSRTVDLIVALGCDLGVKSDFFTQIAGQIEKLGTKKNGMSRSGKIDIKYLIANAMQNLSNKLISPNDSILSPGTMAELIVPQLESFLSTNFSTRFLILHYTSEHLGIVLALQRLVGSETFKVAGILDTLSSDPPSFSRPRTPREINPLSNEATMSRPTSRRLATLTLKQQLSGSSIPPLPQAPQQLQVSFSKANYLIPSTATDAEITVFLSGIWKALMERSSFYNPELPEIEPPKPAATPTIRPVTPRLLSSKAPSATSTRQTPSSSDHTSFPPSSYRAPKSDKIARMTGRTGEHKYAQSIASTVRTTVSERGRREDKEWENFYIADEDSEDDDFDKMILGREFKMIRPEATVVKKRNTKKALKWLGLS